MEVQPVSQASQQDRAQQGESFTGDRLSLNFQDIEVRAVLATLAEFTGLNLVASDSVTGRVTLNPQRCALGPGAGADFAKPRAL
ncbi:hypothetical protein HAALTHF_54120n [Vreelandella aquamarina]|nr:hypothetical protein HAALTHF_54120n [Halomonas axialensis]